METYSVILLSALSIFISIMALYISSKSDQKMKALTNLEFDEKIVMMSVYKDNILNDLSNIRRMKNDLRAVSNLIKYANPKRKEEVIKEYVIPSIENILDEYNIKNEGYKIGSYTKDLKQTIKIALKFNVEIKKLKEIEKKLLNSKIFPLFNGER